MGLVLLAIHERRWYWTLGDAGLCELSGPARDALPAHRRALLVVPRKKMMVMFVPFMLFIGLRWVVARDPSFTSYGAIQATRIYAMMVEPGDLIKVPDKFHPLMTEILNHQNDRKDVLLLDRASERDFYARWMNGDQYHDLVLNYLKDSFPRPMPKETPFCASCGAGSSGLHWRLRPAIYYRALRVAAGKFQQFLLIGFLMTIFWLICMRPFRVAEDKIELGHTVVFRWFGLWVFFSLMTLLLVQVPR